MNMFQVRLLRELRINQDDARVAENAGVVNILATPTTTAGSVSMSRNLILVHIEKLKLLNTMYKLKSREGIM